MNTVFARILLLAALLGYGCGAGSAATPASAPPEGLPARAGAAALASPLAVVLRAGWNPVALQCPQVTSLTPGLSLATFDGVAYRTGPATVAAVNADDGGRRGFWFFAAEATTLNYQGQDDGRGSFIDLHPGWNLVSLAGTTAVPGTGLSTSAGPLASLVLTTFYALQPDGSQLAVDVTQASLQPGVAYWVFAARSGRLLWTPPPPPSPSPSASAAVITQLAIVPAEAVIRRFGSRQLQALGTLAGGGTLDLTSQVAWSSDEPSAVAVGPDGLATALFPGTFTVRARSQGQEGTARITVTDSGEPGPTPTPTPTPTPRQWTSRTSGTASDLRAVCFGGPGAGGFVTVGAGAARNSADGLTWAATTGLAGTQNCVAAAPSGFFCSGDLFRPWSSADGVTFATSLGVVFASDVGNGAAFGNGFGTMVGEFAGAATSRTSADAPPFSATDGQAATGALMRAVAYGTGTRFVAVGGGGLIRHADITTTSPTWNASTSTTASQLNGVCFGAGRWVAVGAGGTIQTSTDNGLTFTATGVTSGSVQNLNAVAFGNNEFIAVGDNGTILSSSNGLTWTADSSGTAVQLLGVTYSASLARYVAVGAGGTILTSP